MYRLLCDLGPFKDGSVLPKGSLDPLKRVTMGALETLLERGCIAKWNSPPLEVLPGWSRKAKVFKTVGITTVAQLLNADKKVLLKKLKISEDALQHCVDEARQWIT